MSSLSQTRRGCTRGERGYVLLTLLLMMALMAIVAATIVTSLKFDIQRDREEEMIHRGAQYARAIRAYYKKFGHDTEVMGASFRNKGEILELAGCDLLTISPQLLGELKQSTDPVERKLAPATAKETKIDRLDVEEKKFRWLMNENAMATEKLSEGIRLFNADAVKLQQLLQAKLPR